MYVKEKENLNIKENNRVFLVGCRSISRLKCISKNDLLIIDNVG